MEGTPTVAQMFDVVDKSGSEHELRDVRISCFRRIFSWIATFQVGGHPRFLEPTVVKFQLDFRCFFSRDHDPHPQGTCGPSVLSREFSLFACAPVFFTTFVSLQRLR